MERSAFEEPPPEPLAESVARGYTRPGGPPLLYCETMQPAVGGMSASAAYLGRFMIALLQPNPLVQPELLPIVFEDDYAAGNHFVGKHGLTDGAVSHLALLPEAGFGMFVSYKFL
jgi:CubicO group peptidase (beta-lactamase class C family)